MTREQNFAPNPIRRRKGWCCRQCAGVKQSNGKVVAVVNNGSNNLAVFERAGNKLVFQRLLSTSSAPVSIDFGNNHMYVACATTVDSFLMSGNEVAFRDGSTGLVLAGGGVPPSGSTAQVGVVDRILCSLASKPIRPRERWTFLLCIKALLFRPCRRLFPRPPVHSHRSASKFIRMEPDFHTGSLQPRRAIPQ